MKVITLFLAIASLGLSPRATEAGTIVGSGTDASGEIDVPPAVTNAVAICAGLGSSLALNADSTITYWGSVFPGPPPPTDLTNIVAISGTAAHNVVLRSDGTVVAWGEGFGKSFVPAGISNIVGVAAGFEHSLTLKSDGTVFGWGSDGYGELDVPAGLSNIIAIAAGGYNTLALKSDGTVAAWGNNSDGQLQVPADLTNVIAISEGAYHALALKADGRVVAWGGDFFGQADVPPDLTNVVAITAGWYNSAALKADGTVVIWPDSSPVQTNPPPTATKIVAVAEGYTHQLLLTGIGAPQIYQPPANATTVAGTSVLFRGGAVGAPTLAYQWKYNGSDISGASRSALLLTNVLPAQAGLYSFVASNSLGSLESPAALLSVVPLIVNVPPTNQTVYVGDDAGFSVGVAAAGPFTYQWRFNDFDLPGETNLALSLTNVTVGQGGLYSVNVTNPYGSLISPGGLLTVVDSPPFFLAQPASVALPAPGGTAIFRAAANGSKPLAYQWRLNGVELPGETNTSLTLTGLTANQVGNYSVRVTNGAGAAVSVNASLVLVPVATIGYPLNASPPPALSNVVALAAGYSHDLGLLPDGTVISWGSISTVPTNVTNIAAIAAGNNQSLALRSNGTVVAWGSTTNVPAAANSNVTAITMGYDAGGNNNFFALKSNGTVVVWGPGNKPYLTNVPPAVNAAVGIAIGVDNAFVLRANGTVAAWGNGSFGQTNIAAGVTNIIALAAGANHCLALGSNGTVVAWGLNSSGQLNPPGNLSNVVAIAAGASHSLALKSDGSLVVWGSNASGQTNLPVTLPPAAAIAAGYNHSLALLGTSDPAIARQPPIGSALPAQAALLSVGVVSQFSVAYQWQFNGQILPNATNAVYKIPTARLTNEGVYSVMLSNQSGVLTSRSAPLAIVRNVILPWGLSSSGQTNVPFTTNKFVALASGYDHSVALKSDGLVVAWGLNSSGQTNVPAGLSNVIAIATGPNHGLALKSNSTVVAWGATTQPPVGLTNVIAIAAGGDHNLALMSNGSVVCWGSNAYGQCTAPTGLTNVIAIAAGHDHSLAIKSDGTVIAWGLNTSGQCNVPAGLTNAVSIVGGDFHTVALKSDGSVLAWGLGSSNQTHPPNGLTNAIALGRGWVNSLVLRSDGSLVVFGGNSFGQFAPPAGLTDVAALGSGRSHSLALIAVSDPLISRQPLAARAWSGNRVLLSAGASSSQPLAFQWRFNGVNIPGATNASLLLNSVQSVDSGIYSVSVSNALGVLTSSNALVTVIDQAPFVLTQPAGQTNIGGASASFQAIADGSPALAFQWQKNGVPINGATNALFNLTNLRRTDAGTFSFVVSNAFGVATGSNAILRVLVPQQFQTPTIVDGTLSLRFSDADGLPMTLLDATHFQVLASTNLVDWTALTNTLTLTNGTLAIEEAETNVAQLFYRVLEQP